MHPRVIVTHSVTISFSLSRLLLAVEKVKNEGEIDLEVSEGATKRTRNRKEKTERTIRVQQKVTG